MSTGFNPDLFVCFLIIFFERDFFVKFAAPIFAELGFCEEKARVNSEMICSTKVFSRKHWNGFDDTIKSRFLHF